MVQAMARFLLVVLVVACGDGASAQPDAAVVDAGEVDAPIVPHDVTDAPPDAAIDAGEPDAAPDAALDAGPDAPVDPDPPVVTAITTTAGFTQIRHGGSARLVITGDRLASVTSVRVGPFDAVIASQ